MKGFAFDVEVLFLALKRQHKIKRLPVVLRSTEGNSVRLLKHGLIMMKEIVFIKMRYLLGKYPSIKN